MTTKRRTGEVRFLATKAIVGGLAVATFLATWAGIAAVSSVSNGASEAGAAEAAAATGAPAEVMVIERQVVYYIVDPTAPAGVPVTSSQSRPSVSSSAAPSTSSAPPKATTPTTTKKKSRSS